MTNWNKMPDNIKLKPEQRKIIVLGTPSPFGNSFKEAWERELNRLKDDPHHIPITTPQYRINSEGRIVLRTLYTEELEELKNELD